MIEQAFSKIVALVAVLFCILPVQCLAGDTKLAQAPAGRFDERSLLKRGRALLDQRHPQEALTQFFQYSAIKQSDPEGYFWQGVAFDELNRPSESVQAYKMALLQAQKNGMDSPESWTNLGNALLKAGSVEEAISAFNKAIELDPQLATAYLNLARAQLQSGKAQAALESLATCSELRFNGPQLPYYKAKALKACGRKEEAAAQINQLLLRVPEGSQQRAALQAEFQDVLEQKAP